MTHEQKPDARREAGMSLVETTIALAVLGVGILAMIAAQVTALQQNNQGRHSTEAAQVARDQMEFMQRLPWTHAVVTPSGTWSAARASTVTVQRGVSQASYVEETFNTSWRVQNGATPDLRRVDVRVTWAEDGPAGIVNRTFVMSGLKVNE